MVSGELHFTKCKIKLKRSFICSASFEGTFTKIEERPILNNLCSRFILSERRVSGSNLDPNMMKQLLDQNEVLLHTMNEERPILNNLCSRFILFKDLKKQNNFLKLKVELLLDMLAQKSAEADILQKDIDQIRKCLLPQ